MTHFYIFQNKLLSPSKPTVFLITAKFKNRGTPVKIVVGTCRLVGFSETLGDKHLENIFFIEILGMCNSARHYKFSWNYS